jgi:O-antigen chain-terminating methyltransferase
VGKYQDRIRKTRRKYLAYFDKRGKILEIGCGSGELIALFQEEGYSIHGVDVNLQAIRHCHKQNLMASHQDALSFLKQNENTYDGIICSHLVEHIAYNDIDIFFECCYKSLTQKGILIIITPNIHHLGGSASFWNDPSHIRPFTVASLRKLLNKFKYQIIDIGYDKDTKITVKKDLLNLPIDIIRILLGFIIYGHSGFYTEVFAIGEK